MENILVFHLASLASQIFAQRFDGSNSHQLLLPWDAVLSPSNPLCTLLPHPASFPNPIHATSPNRYNSYQIMKQRPSSYLDLGRILAVTLIMVHYQDWLSV